MKKIRFIELMVGVTLFSATAQAQTVTNPNVESYTNSDLSPNPVPTHPVAPTSIPNASNAVNTTANQNAPFKYPALTQDQLQQFYDQVNGQVQAAEQRVQSLTNMIQDTSRMPMDIDRYQLQGAIIDLDVKKTLAAKFQGSPSLKSPKVRQALMQVLAKNYIQESDLATLQATVDAERPYTYP